MRPTNSGHRLPQQRDFRREYMRQKRGRSQDEQPHQSLAHRSRPLRLDLGRCRRGVAGMGCGGRIHGRSKSSSGVQPANE
ncbi:hypothetical protein [Lysobacter gummosus]|uniref:hypothetical protein n=1 Tax=Lysobacter gummosus TaxID=262324 RepID=UPI0036319C21